MQQRLTRRQIIQGLTELGKLAEKQGTLIEIVVCGGALQCIDLRTREATHDIDCMFLSPNDRMEIMYLANQVAKKNKWSLDWLNDGPRIYLRNREELKHGVVLLRRPGLIVRRPSYEQLLMMKLIAWRTLLDQADALALLKKVVKNHTILFIFKPSKQKVWDLIEPYIPKRMNPDPLPTAKDAYNDLWEVWKSGRNIL